MIAADIFKQIRQELDDFNQPIRVADGYWFNTKKMINKIILYINSQFESGNKDSRGRRKFFYNIVLFRRDTTKRLIDIDIKHFRFLAKNTINNLKSAIFESKFKDWARNNDFGTLLNQMAEQAATFGTTVIKLTDQLVPSVVDLRKLAFEPSAENLQKSTYVIEEHILTPDEFLAKRDIWKNVDAVYEQWKESGENYIKVYERQGLVPESWVKKGGKESKLVKSMFFVYDVNNYEKTKQGTIEKGIVLYKQAIDRYQYFDFSIRKVAGRLLGVGDIELLLDAQVRRNEIANQKAVAMEISSKHLFVTPDDTISGNFLTDYLDGTIIKGQLTPVATENRDLSSWRSEEQVWDALADRLTFTYDVVRGESIPATTPATNALIQERQSLSNFALMRQNFGLFFEKLIREYILPKLKKEFNASDLIRIIADSSDDIERIDDLILDELGKFYAYDYLQKTGFYPDNLEQFKEQLRQEIKKGGLIRVVQHGKKYFDDVEMDLIVNVTNESIDPATELINLQNFMAQIANPAVLQDPLLKKFLYKIAERMGISITDIQKLEEKKVTQPTGLTELAGQNVMPGSMPTLHSMSVPPEKVSVIKQ